MKIKTFNSFLNDAETAVNKFLEDKTYIDLKTDTVVHNNKIFTQYTLIYEDGGKTEEVPVQTMDGVTTYTRPKGSDEPFRRVETIGGADFGSGESISISVPVSVNPAHHDSSNFIDRAYEKKLMSIHSPTGYIDVTDSKYKVADDIKNRMGRFE